MIKDINPHKLSKSSGRKLTYPGRRAEEIADQIESTHVHSPHTEVIIHAGTNNLITDSSRECFNNIQLLISNIKKRFNGTKFQLKYVGAKGSFKIRLELVNARTRTTIQKCQRNQSTKRISQLKNIFIICAKTFIQYQRHHCSDSLRDWMFYHFHDHFNNNRNLMYFSGSVFHNNLLAISTKKKWF